MQPEVISREIVKPSSNIHPKVHNLSLFDQIIKGIYMSLVLFYTSKNGKTGHNHTSTVLKSSLSAVLSRYYPLAGKTKDDLTIDCNDEGALFIESKHECGLSEFLKNLEFEILKPLFPDSLGFKDSSLAGPLAIQVTYFKCGGMSIGICVCHKILDMAGMSAFIKDWSSLARESDKEIHPEFSIGSLYPPIDLSILQEKQIEPPSEHKDCVYTRVVFNGSKIAKLKEMVADQVPNPTRVEVVASLLYKAAIYANSKACPSGSLLPSVMTQAVSLHTKVSPPLSEQNRGNILGMISIESGMEEREVQLGFLVKEFRKARTELLNSCAASSKEDLCQLTLNNLKSYSTYHNERQVYGYSSWCRFPFYESDFGWGKPLWVSTVPMKVKNLFILIDTREGDGIEALISLEEKVMAMFENDQELLSFACISPTVLDLDPNCV